MNKENTFKSNLISVIVPIYKVEKYLDRCIKSIINQTYQNLEIILVDDGSPDNCPKMCDVWAKQDARIKVIHKENGGLSDARNVGIKEAKGDYISFLDSDDWIDVDTYRIIMKKMISTNSQIGAFNLICVESNDFNPDLTEKYSILSAEQAIENTIDNVGVKTVAWNKVYRKDILDGLWFPKGKLHEDEFFTFRALARAERIVYLHRQCYYYFQRPSSIMGHYDVRHIDMLEGVKSRMEFIEIYFPALFSKAKISLSSCCIYQYQMLLRNKNHDPDVSYRKKVIDIRRSFQITRDDAIGLNKKSVLIHRASNTSLGLILICGLKNLLDK